MAMAVGDNLVDAGKTSPFRRWLTRLYLMGTTSVMIHVHVILLVDMVKVMHVVCLIRHCFGVRYPSDSLLCQRLELCLGNAEVSTETLNDLFKMLS